MTGARGAFLSCPICEVRKPKRFCPAEGKKICAVCCGTGRETTIDCPSDCAYLMAARRYEREHRQSIPADQLPFPETRIPADLVDARQDVVLLLGQALVEAAGETRATDDDALTALTAMAETYRTLQSGILYEQAPAGTVARELYGRLAKTLEDYKQAQTERVGFPNLKDSEVFGLLVFLLRLGKQEINERPRSRAYLDFLRASLPARKSGPEPSRIITA
jgi:hypothetical protein